jgi:hypothetical protein
VLDNRDSIQINQNGLILCPIWVRAAGDAPMQFVSPVPQHSRMLGCCKDPAGGECDDAGSRARVSHPTWKGKDRHHGVQMPPVE